MGLIARMDALDALVAGCGKVAVAFSGGVDSTVVAHAANRVLGQDALIVLVHTETIVDEDVALARGLAAQHAFNFLEVTCSEVEIERNAANRENRCSFCKGALFQRLAAIARERDIPVMFDGFNIDDEGDYRPGRQAARELGVRSPLIETGFTRKDVRNAARLYGLPNHDTPAAPCLPSRIPYGMVIDAASLVRIARAEREIRELILRQPRRRGGAR